MNIFLIIMSSLISYVLSGKIYSRLAVIYPEYNIKKGWTIKYLSILINAILQFAFLNKISGVNFIESNSMHKLFLITCFISLILISSCIACSCIIDLHVFELPDETNLIILLSMIPISLYFYSGKSILTGLIIFLIYFALALYTDSFGMGDVKLAVALGLGIKLSMTLKFMFLSFLFAAIVGIFKIIIKKTDLKSEIAFGPYIALSFILLFI